MAILTHHVRVHSARCKEVERVELSLRPVRSLSLCSCLCVGACHDQYALAGGR